MAQDILDILIEGASGTWNMFNSILDATGMAAIVISVIVLSMIMRLIISPILGYRLDIESRDPDALAYKRYARMRNVKTQYRKDRNNKNG